jgi:hypothetical protein
MSVFDEIYEEQSLEREMRSEFYRDYYSKLRKVKDKKKE